MYCMLFCFYAVLRAQKLEFLLVLSDRLGQVVDITADYLAIFTLPGYLRLVLSHASSANYVY